MKDSTDTAKLELFLRGYPNGQFSTPARMRLLLLKKANAQAQMKATPAKRVAPSVDEYLSVAGKGAKLVPPGELDIDGTKVYCGTRPTVLDPKLRDFQASYPGFIILNPRLFGRVPKVVKLWIYSQGCGFQFRGPDVETADCFAVQRGLKHGWLTSEGMDEVCRFITPAERDSEHLPGG